jgi:hypothetical protein
VHPSFSGSWTPSLDQKVPKLSGPGFGFAFQEKTGNFERSITVADSITVNNNNNKPKTRRKQDERQQQQQQQDE